MKRTRRTFLFLLSLLCMLLPTAHHFGSSYHQRTNQRPTDKSAGITFTIETKEKAVTFFDPLVLRVVLRNNSSSPISFDSTTLRLIPESWHVVGTWGEWMEGEGLRLSTENNSAGRIELPVGASLGLFAVEKWPTFESLGPVRVAYKLSGTDSSTRNLLPANYAEVKFNIPPTQLISSVWTAKTDSEHNMAQPGFNEFLRFRAEAQKDDEKKDFQKGLRDHRYAAKTIFYMAGYALPFLERAARDKDSFLREQAVLAYPYAARAIEQLDAFLDALDEIGPRPQWALALTKNRNKEKADWRSFAVAALNDPAPNVRIAGVSVLTKSHWDQYSFDVLEAGIGFPKSSTSKSGVAAEQGEQSSDLTNARNAQEIQAREFNAVKALSADADAGVRGAVQNYLASFAGENIAANVVADSLVDQDRIVRERALNALLRSPQAPPLEAIKRAFVNAKGKTATGLIPLLFEQEDASLPTTLIEGFKNRSEEERLAIVSVIAGHADPASLELVKLGLHDPSLAVQRVALMRLVAFSAEIVIPLIDAYALGAPVELQHIAQAVKQEVETRTLWPFLRNSASKQTSASESAFPSENGTMPVVSPDGNWIAYVETGWGRPGGSGGFGRSNLLSISHALRNNGANDRVVSDMFLIGWLSDSSGVATARDGFAAVTDLNGKVVAEFGDPLEEAYKRSIDNGADWRTSNLREQFGGEMPHQKRLHGIDDFDFSEGGASSPDGKWYGPLRGRQKVFFLGAGGEKISLTLPVDLSSTGVRAMWSPSGRYVQLDGDSAWLIIDMQTRRSHTIQNIDSTILGGDWGYRECRWNPWSKDGSRLTFLRDGQVWVSGPNGEDAKQLTFDSTRKAFPTFSRDGRSIAYLTWQADDRLHYTRLGPTDLWVVDTETTLVTRVTAPSKGRINSLDWLDDHTLIFDRLEQEDDKSFRPSPRSSLRRLSLR